MAKNLTSLLIRNGTVLSPGGGAKRQDVLITGPHVVRVGPRLQGPRGARVIDAEVHRFLNEANQRAIQILTEHREKLDSLTAALVEKESLDRNEISAIIGPPVSRDGE